MSLEIWLTFLGTVLALTITRGLCHLLMLSNGMMHGAQRVLATAADDLSVNLVQTIAAGAGLATVLSASANAFAVATWAGVAYRSWMAWRTFDCAPFVAARAHTAPSASLLSTTISHVRREPQGRCLLCCRVPAIH